MFSILATPIVIIIATAWFFSTYQVKAQNPVHIALATPILIARRQVVVNEMVMADPNNSPLDPIQQYICNKFGNQCKTALAIARAESNDNCNEINVNTNGTVDFGIFMENSVHLNRQFTLADLSTCERMVDRAYDLYKQTGWAAWSSYQSGAYKKFLF